MQDKYFLKTSEQIATLRNRHLVIDDEASVANILREENYYNLINGYKDLFLKSPKADEKNEEYNDGTNFLEIYSLYLFDRELRALFIKFILLIENNIKSVLAHVVSGNGENGHRDYLRIENFDCKSINITALASNHSRSNSQDADRRTRTSEIIDMISVIQREIAHQLKKNNSMIGHYMLDYGYVPLWVLVNTLSFGTISKFYSFLKQKDQNQIARQFGVKPDHLETFLAVLTIFRNACAHDERFFSLRTERIDHTDNSIKNTNIHESLKIEKNSSGNYIYGKNDLFAVVIILKSLLTDSKFKEFFSSLQAELNKLNQSLHTINIDIVTKKMGFPSNWTEIESVPASVRNIPEDD